MMIKELFAPLAMKIAGGIAASLFIALVFTMWRADSLSEQRDEAKAALVTEQARHAVTRTSVALLTSKMEGFVREGELRAERLDNALSEVEDETASLRAQADKLEAGKIDITDVEGL